MPIAFLKNDITFEIKFNLNFLHFTIANVIIGLFNRDTFFIIVKIISYFCKCNVGEGRCFDLTNVFPLQKYYKCASENSDIEAGRNSNCSLHGVNEDLNYTVKRRKMSFQRNHRKD